MFVCIPRWMEACVEEELPSTTDLEEGLRNGVYLGKLAKFFAPKMVSEKKIYDRDQARYKVTFVLILERSGTAGYSKLIDTSSDYEFNEAT